MEAEREAMNERASFERSMQMHKDELFFKEGRLPPEHPLAMYVEQLVRKLEVKDGFVPKVVILPGMASINALSLPDATICIGIGLLRAVPTEEALLGVLAHEYVHAYREHTKKQKQGTELVLDDKINLLHRMSLGRIHEYEADLRGVLVDLDKAGINPMGYKIFLEQLHERQQWGGRTHGSSLDRALNIATATYSLDLRGIDADLHSLPPEYVAMANETVFSNASAVCRRMFRRGTTLRYASPQECE